MNDIHNRLSKDEYAVYLAYAASSRSEDPFIQAGAALFNDKGETLGTGFNGLKPGHKITDELKKEENRPLRSKYFIHAEQNLFARSQRGGFLLGLTCSPCEPCSRIIVANGIKRVVFPYIRKDSTGKICDEFKELFNFHGVQYHILSADEIQNIVNILHQHYSTLSFNHLK